MRFLGAAAGQRLRLSLTTQERSGQVTDDLWLCYTREA